jgi:spore germination cell wall hydrolase CwlJ-like protein
MAAVACVVLNRVRHQTYWGRGVDEVCRKPYQFSCWNPGDRNRAKLLAVQAGDPQFRSALRIAADAVTSRLADPTRGATHYHARSLAARPPRWAVGHRPCAVIGHHLFFNDVR